MNGRFSVRLFQIFSFQAWRQPKWAFQGFATPTNARDCAFAGWALQQQTAARLAFRSRVLTRFLRLLPFLEFRPISHHRPKPWRKECGHGLPPRCISCGLGPWKEKERAVRGAALNKRPGEVAIALLFIAHCPSGISAEKVFWLLEFVPVFEATGQALLS